MLRIIRTAKAISRNRQGLSPAWGMAEARKRKIAAGECGAVVRAPSSGSDAFVLRRDDRGLSMLYRTAVTESRRKGKIPVEAASQIRRVVAGRNSRCCGMVLMRRQSGK
jgi:hypothetical protein